MSNSFKQVIDLSKIIKDKIMSQLAAIAGGEVLEFTRSFQIKVEQNYLEDKMVASFSATGITVDGYIIYQDEYPATDQEIHIEELDIYEQAYIADLLQDQANYKTLQT